jgi:hypothetical protein
MPPSTKHKFELALLDSYIDRLKHENDQLRHLVGALTDGLEEAVGSTSKTLNDLEDAVEMLSVLCERGRTFDGYAREERPA